MLAAGAGRAETARLVADINRGPDRTNGSGLRQLTVAADRVVFLASEPSSGTALWTSDGTALWTSDGTALGTRLLRDFEPGPPSPADLLLLGSNGQLAFFYLNSADNSYGEVWRTDGTDEGTIPLGFGEAVYPFAARRTEEVVVRGSTLFVSSCEIFGACELWRSDGSPGDAVRLAGRQGMTEIEGLAMAGANVYFNAVVDGFYELWKSDGTPAGTAAVRTGLGFPPASPLRAVAGSRLVFIAHDADGDELGRATAHRAARVGSLTSASPTPSPTTCSRSRWRGSAS